MNIKSLLLVVTLLAVSQIGACNDPESLPSEIGASVESESVETSTPTTTTIGQSPAATVTQVSNDAQSGGTVTPELPAPTIVTVIGRSSASEELRVECSFDSRIPQIACQAIGMGSSSSLRWESNIWGWNTGPTYEIVLDQEYQLVPTVTVVLEACQDQACERIETSIDTSILVPSPTPTAVPEKKSSQPAQPTATPRSTPASTSSTVTSKSEEENTPTPTPTPTPASIVSLTCDDAEITARYLTTCRADLDGQIDWIRWKFERSDLMWDRIENSDIRLEDVLVQEITRAGVGEYVVGFTACTGGGDWRPDSKCVDGTVNIQVVPGARWAKEIPCDENPNPVFPRWILDAGQTVEVWGNGTASHHGTSQHSYIYPDYDLEPDGVPVYAPVDSYLYQAMATLTYSNGVKDYGLKFMVSCEVTYLFGHVVNPEQWIVDLVAAEANEEGHGTWVATPALKYVTPQIDPVFVKAGSVLFHHLPNRPGTNQGFDFGVYNGTYTNEFLNPDRWRNADTFVHSVCPHVYFGEPVRSQVTELYRDGTCYGVNREVVGTLAGMWHFADSSAPLPERHDFRYGGDLVFVEYFDGLVHVGGLYSFAVGGIGGPSPDEEFILRVSPDNGTYRLPQEVTKTHCYEGSNDADSAGEPGMFLNMFVYAEIIDENTIHVAFDDGTCPASLPAEYTVYSR